MKTNSLLENVDLQSFDRISSFDEPVLTAEVTAAKACENSSLTVTPKALIPWIIFGANNQIIHSFTRRRSR